MQVFLVEDDKIYSDYISRSLRQNENVNVTTFSSAEEVLEKMNGTLPEVLILDYKLPGMTGIDLYENIRPLIKNQKVILYSSINDGTTVLDFIQKGVRDYVIKDENVVDALEAVISGKDEYFFG